jgi:hypothetical protein
MGLNLIKPEEWKIIKLITPAEVATWQEPTLKSEKIPWLPPWLEPLILAIYVKLILYLSNLYGIVCELKLKGHIFHLSNPRQNLYLWPFLHPNNIVG